MSNDRVSLMFTDFRASGNLSGREPIRAIRCQIKIPQIKEF
jgi:hypothetical protein